jgi:hypothetical protein
MTDLPYIFASYALFAVVVIVLAVAASLRLASARKRLAVLDQRAKPRPPAS